MCLFLALYLLIGFLIAFINGYLLSKKLEQMPISRQIRRC